jgi:hypothetical protein
VIDLERRDPQPVFLENHPLVDVLGQDHHALGRRPIVRLTDPDVELIGLLELRHHLLRSPRPPDRKRTVASRSYEPARQPEIRKADHVIRVKVCQKETVDVLPADLDLGETLQRTSAGVEEEFLPGCFDQDAGSESIHGRHRRARSEQGDFDFGGKGLRGRGSCAREDEQEKRGELLREKGAATDHAWSRSQAGAA